MEGSDAALECPQGHQGYPDGIESCLDSVTSRCFSKLLTYGYSSLVCIVTHVHTFDKSMNRSID